MKLGRSDASFVPGEPGIARLWPEAAPDAGSADARRGLLEDQALAAAADAPPAVGPEPGTDRLWPETAPDGWTPLGG